MASKKGATEFDKKCHSIFDAKNDGRDYLARGVNLPCPNCGAPMTDKAVDMVMERLEALNANTGSV